MRSALERRTIPRKKAYEKVTVMVTDVDEPGNVTLLSVQPQVDIDLTAILTDDDATVAQINATANKWKWEHASTANGPWTLILTAETEVYKPIGVEDKYLRVTATYTDGHGSDKTAQAVSANMVRAASAANNAVPVFTDEDPDMEDTINVNRSVDENSPPGANVGKPVVANDAPGDVLTYTLDDAGAMSFDINPATGQITVGARTTLDADTETTATYTVMVTATDPAGGADGDCNAASDHHRQKLERSSDDDRRSHENFPVGVSHNENIADSHRGQTPTRLRTLSPQPQGTPIPVTWPVVPGR